MLLVLPCLDPPAECMRQLGLAQPLPTVGEPAERVRACLPQRQPRRPALREVGVHAAPRELAAHQLHPPFALALQAGLDPFGGAAGELSHLAGNLALTALLQSCDARLTRLAYRLQLLAERRLASHHISHARLAHPPRPDRHPDVKGVCERRRAHPVGCASDGGEGGAPGGGEIGPRRPTLGIVRIEHSAQHLPTEELDPLLSLRHGTGGDERVRLGGATAQLGDLIEQLDPLR